MAAVLFAALMTTTVLTSCSSDSDDEPAKATFTKAVVKYTVKSDDASLGLYKVNVYGTDAEGKDFVETLSNPSYTKTVEIPVSKLPCTVHLYTVISPLENKAATQDFDFYLSRDLNVMTLNNDDTVVGAIERGNTSAVNKIPEGTSLSEFAKTMNGHTKLVFYIDANGKITDQTQKQ